MAWFPLDVVRLCVSLCPLTLQLQRSSKEEQLLSELYQQNQQLLEALEVSGQRQKITEKKNYLLEEKISSLNKLLCDLKPPPVLAALMEQHL